MVHLGMRHERHSFKCRLFSSCRWWRWYSGLEVKTLVGGGGGGAGGLRSSVTTSGGGNSSENHNIWCNFINKYTVTVGGERWSIY